MARKPAASDRPAALITGGAKGMGRAITLALAADGYDIGIITRKSESAARAVCTQCERLGVFACYWKADLTDIDATEEISRDFVREYKRWDVLVNNIGDYWTGPLLSMKTDTLKDMFQSNFSAAARLSLLATKIMRLRKQGRIVNIGWVFADRLQGIPDAAAYHAAKTALVSFSSSLAKVAIADGVTINLVSPGMHYTSVDLPKDPKKVIPAGRFSSDEDIIGAVRYFLSPQASYVTGSNIKVSGGYGV